METSNHLTESWSQPWQSVLSSQLWRLEHLYWIENKAGQLQRQTSAGHHSVHARFHSGADRGRIILRCHHGVDGYHARALCDLLCLPDLGGQCTVVGTCRVAGKVRLPVACIGGGDAPHAAAGRHGTGQPAEGNAHAHAAL